MRTWAFRPHLQTAGGPGQVPALLGAGRARNCDAGTALTIKAPSAPRTGGGHAKGRTALSAARPYACTP